MSSENDGQPWHDESLLRELYIEQDLTMLQISSQLNCSDGTVCRALNEFGISKPQSDEPWRDESILRELYVDEGLTCYEIGEQLDCAGNTVVMWLQRTGVIDERDDKPWKSKEILSELYHSMRSRKEVADELGCSQGTIGYWLTKLGIANVRKDVEFDSDEPKFPWRDEETLQNALEKHSYVREEVAKEFEASPKTIKRWMGRHGIEEPGIELSRDDYPEDYPWREKWVLEELHHEKRLSQNKISMLFGCSQHTISNWMDRFDIEVQTNTDKPSKEYLHNLYINQELSTIQLSLRFGVDDDTVRRWLVHFGIQTRSPARRDQLVQELRDGEWLEEQHLEKEKSLAQISRDLDCNTATVRKWALYHDIDIRPAGASIRGENHPHWKGGKEPYGKGWNERKKERVRDRDNRVCQACGLDEEEHVELTGKRLHVHHIIPARQFDDAEMRNSMDNLVSLCNVCHKQWEGIPVRPTYTDD